MDRARGNSREKSGARRCYLLLSSFSLHLSFLWNHVQESITRHAKPSRQAIERITPKNRMSDGDFDLPALHDPLPFETGGERPKDHVLMIPLRQWMGVTGGESIYQDSLHSTRNKKASLIRKVTVAYAVAKVLQHVAEYSVDEIDELCSIDNFVVRVVANELSYVGWEVSGIDVISPEISVQIRPNWLPNTSGLELAAADIIGRDVEVEITDHSRANNAKCDSEKSGCDEKLICYMCGRLLHLFFTGVDIQNVTVKGHPKDDYDSEPSHKKKHFLSDNPFKTSCDIFHRMKSLDFSQGTSSMTKSDSSKMDSSDRSDGNYFMPLFEVGYPSSISQLVSNLLDCGANLFRSDDSYQNLQEGLDDMHFFLRGPAFLFEHQMERLSIGVGKLYGRAKEAALFRKTFCRVISTGETEAICVRGFSGCGKTRLVQSVFENVDAANGFVCRTKFDLTIPISPLSMFLTSLNELCGAMVEKLPRQKSREMYERIQSQTNMTILTRILPNVIRMHSSDAHVPPSDHDVSNDLNCNMLAFALMKLFRVISSISQPVMVFLDDIQWASEEALDLVHAILSDMRGENCIFFVASYRDQDVDEDHFAFDFISAVRSFGTPVTYVNIGGLDEEDLNHMLSDALCVLPRLCRPLSSLVHHKTNGSPFYTVEFFNALISRGILVYSLRERRWIWDIDQISYMEVTDNVLHLIINKMKDLSRKDRIALEVASCFGCINETTAQILSETRRYSGLKSNLDKAVECGFMEHDEGIYRFKHDKVREAAYELIVSKEKYHFDVGMSLYSILKDRNEEDWSDKVPEVLFQINHGVPALLTCEEIRISVAELNYKQSVKALAKSDFSIAHIYMTKAVSLLPAKNPWESHYDQCIKYFFQHASTSYPRGYIVEARESLNKIIENVNCIEHKIPSYFLLAKILFLSCQELPQAFAAYRNMLEMLGEAVPDVQKAKDESHHQMTQAKQMLENSDLLRGVYTKTDDWKTQAIMQAYDQLAMISFMSSPNASPYYTGRWAQYTLRNNVFCQFTPKCLVSLAGILCTRGTPQDAKIGYQIGKKALSMLDHSQPEVVAAVYLTFYGFVGTLFEPMQACTDMHRRGYELALQAGNLSLAAFYKTFILSLSTKIGVNLLELKQEIDAELSLATHRCQSFLAMRLRCHRETTLRLIGNKANNRPALFSDDELVKTPNLLETQLVNEMLASTYLCEFERVRCLSQLWDSVPEQKRVQSHQRLAHVKFFSGLAVAAMARRQHDLSQLRIIDDAISFLEDAEDLCPWNYKNKVALLKAELASVEGDDDDEAELQYDLAIEAARTSKFIHEEGLACELAGCHSKHHRKVQKALDLFRDAERCYQIWGSQIKAGQMAGEITSLTLLNNIFD